VAFRHLAGIGFAENLAGHITWQIDGLPESIVRKVTWENASRLYQHPVPVAVREDPNAF